LCFRLCRSSRLTLRKQRRGQCGQQHEDKVRRAAGSMSARALAWDERAHGVAWNLQRPMDLW
jgi:hypothetical protein